MEYGKVKTWNNEKKFGFITTNDGTKDLFFHISQLPPNHMVQIGEIVSYEQGKDKQGRVCAVNINNSQSYPKSNNQTRPQPKSSGTQYHRQPRKSGFQRMRPFKQVCFVIAMIIVAISMIVQCSQKIMSSNSMQTNAANNLEFSTGQSENNVEYTSGQSVIATGSVIRILADDNDGSRHQKFILQMPDRTLLIAHNIDIAPRISNLNIGDRVTFKGIYEPNDKGGVIHWTHRDPSGRNPGGWLQHNGTTYQ